ncbi:Ribonuclease II [Nymphaea thermarum]|nr:Ribonuclease II [Nymphaea thermarum]
MEDMFHQGQHFDGGLHLQIIYGATEPLESYCAHLLLSKDEIYFRVLESKGYCPVYGRRPVQQKNFETIRVTYRGIMFLMTSKFS